MPPQEIAGEEEQEQKQPQNEEESEAFIKKDAKNGDVKVEIVETGKGKHGQCPMQLHESSPSSPKRCPCSCCSWKRCGIAAAIVIGLVLIICGVGYWRMRNKYSGTAIQHDKQKILERIRGRGIEDEPENTESIIGGNYVLKDYDENYRKYLEAMGTPSLVVSLFIDFNDIYVFKVPKNETRPWSWYSDTPSGQLTSKFKLGQEFSVPWGRKTKGVYSKICKLEQSNVLKCEFEERKKNWKFLETLTFVETGMVQEIDFETHDIQTVRSFDRLTKEELKALTSNANSPFDEDDIDDFGDDNWGEEEF